MKRAALYSACMLALAVGARAQAQSTDYDTVSQSDFAGIGLLQTPTARMAPAGELSVNINHVSPYTRLNVFAQPLDWLEGGFTYTNISYRRYGSEALSGHQDYKDKAISGKVRLWRESQWWPAIAVGARDIGGTSLFSSEYLVANKRVYDLDFSLGLAWGYLGARGNLPSPFGWVDNRFKTRSDTGNHAGDFSHKYFRGRTAVFGGIRYQTPWQPLVLKLEYEGNNYRHEPFGKVLRQRSPVNLGAVYHLGRHLDLNVAYERGSQVMFGVTLHGNLANGHGPDKVLDPPPEPLAQPASPAPATTNWADVSQRLQHNAGIKVDSIARRGRELVITGEQDTFFYPAEGLGRAARIAGHIASPPDWVTLINTRYGLPISQTSVHRQRVDALIHHDIGVDDMRRSVETTVPVSDPEEKVEYRAPLKRFHGTFSGGYQQIVGGPDSFILYQIDASYDADYRLSRHTWLSGHLAYDLLNNYDKFKYDAPSKLPRVRTDIRHYVTDSRLHLSDLQFNGAWQLGQNTYGMVYAGLLESMYGGAGGEVLYRPVDSRWALGADANWVRQRGFDQHLGWRDYHVATGHLTAYVDTGIDHVLATVSVGRYLARDYGGTLNLSKVFSNGVRMGVWATVTNVSGNKYGEGSFDKGMYVTIPFDLMLPRSTTSQFDFVWQPLYRDGGAFLNHRYRLYPLTSERDSRLFDDNLDLLTH